MSTRLQRIEDNTQEARERLVRVETKLDNHLELHADHSTGRRWKWGVIAASVTAIAVSAASFFHR